MNPVGVQKRFDSDAGYVTYLEFPHALFITELRTNRKGNGRRLMRQVVARFREIGKTVYGRANPLEDSIDADRLAKMYYHFGAKPLHPGRKPQAVVLEFNHG